MEDVEHVEKEMKLIDANGVRLDGRKYDELRPIRIEAGVLKRADGSAYIEWGGNKVLAAVYGPVGEMQLLLERGAEVNDIVNMAAIAVVDAQEQTNRLKAAMTS